jgi:sterol desaturase/sphingolipid hydroxylase (fatty acid hydroxylase superfamily)
VPRRERSFPRSRRWPHHAGLTLVNAAVTRVLAPFGAVGFAVWAETQGWGWLQSTAWPSWIEWVVSLVALDCAIYWQHRSFHAIPLLWRLHRTHHSDIDVDVSTGLRFHPLEIALSLGVKFLVVSALGSPAGAVLTFEILLNAISMFNHSNGGMRPRLERMLRWIVVTPDMHRVHHSVAPDETNSNFGFNLPWWDRVFRTYRAEPREGHASMALGVGGWREAKDSRLDQLLLQPFNKKKP